METNKLDTLAQKVLPSAVLTYFNIVNIESTSTEIFIHLDEKMSDSLNIH